jgi:hypothetical protein
VTADRPLDLLPALRCPTRAAGRSPRLDARNERQHRPSPGCRQRRWRRTARRDRPVGRGRRRRAGVAGDSVPTVGTPGAECKCVFDHRRRGALVEPRGRAGHGRPPPQCREGTVIEGARVRGAVGRPPGWETEWEVSAHRGRKPPTHSPVQSRPLRPARRLEPPPRKSRPASSRPRRGARRHRRALTCQPPGRGRPQGELDAIAGRTGRPTTEA